MKLTSEDVQCIRSMVGSASEIAAQFNVSRSTIKAIRNGNSRMSVPGYVRPKMASHVKGSDVTGSKLCESDVLEIRRSTMSNVELAVQFGVTRQTIWRVRKHGWRHIDSHASPAIEACFNLKGSGRTGAELEAHFWTKVDVRKPGQCWLWKGGLFKDGYSQFWVGNKKVKAHRFAYVLAFGSIPNGLHVMHVICDTPRCCNPNHLKLGTNADNVADRNNKNRQARGIKMGSAKLTEAQVHEIRASTELQTEIAERFGIGKQHVTDIKSRRRWAWLPDEPDTSHMSPAIPACFSLESTLDEFSQYRKRVDSDTAAAMLMMVDTLNNLDDTRLPN